MPLTSGQRFTFWRLTALCAVSAALVLKLGCFLVESFYTHSQNDKLPIECVLLGVLVLVTFVAFRGASSASRRR